MKFNDLSGQRFGKLLVLGINPEHKYDGSHNITWECQCDCGKIVYKTASTLKSPMKSGVKACDRRCGNLIPNGTVFSRLTVVEPILGEKGNTKYRCLCECGNEAIVSGNNLKKGTTTSCGCYRRERMSEIGKQTQINDITGQRFGKLIALRPTDKRQCKSVVWECQCDCGQLHLASSHNLLHGDVTRCPNCNIISKGEEKIAELLTQYNLSFIKEKTFESCINPNSGRLLRFDFFVDNSYLIEFDGKQHFEPINFFTMGQAEYGELQSRDKLKNQWCVDNHIPLIRIPYTHLKFLTIKDLLPQTTSFLEKGEKNYD